MDTKTKALLVSIPLIILFGWWFSEVNGVVNIITYNPPYEFSTVVNSASALGSLVLSIALIWLYSQQKDILKEQKNLAKSKERAELHIKGYTILSGYDIQNILSSEDDITYEKFPDSWKWLLKNGMASYNISNIDEGVAHHLTAELYFKTEEYGKITQGFVVTRGNILNNVLTKGEIMHQYAFNEVGGSIGGNEREVEFSHWIFIEKGDLPDDLAEYNDTDLDRITPSEVLWTLADAGVQATEIGLILRFEDRTGKKSSKRLFTVNIDPAEYSDFGNVMYDGEIAMSKTREKSSILSRFYED